MRSGNLWNNIVQGDGTLVALLQTFAGQVMILGSTVTLQKKARCRGRRKRRAPRRQRRRAKKPGRHHRWCLSQTLMLSGTTNNCGRFSPITTVHKYLMASGFSSHVGRRRTAGYKLNFDSLVELYVADVRRFWELGIKHMPPGRVACIDSSSIGWQLLTRKTYSPKVANNQKSKRVIQRIRTSLFGLCSLMVSIDAQRFCLRAIRSLLSDRARKRGSTICSKSTKLIRAESCSVRTKSK